MAKLYPPNIEGKLPAFVGTTLVVPFSMNRAVGPGEVKNLQIIIRYLNRDTNLYTGPAVNFDLTGSSELSVNGYKNNCFASFNILEVLDKFIVGQYYRVQLAYIGLSGEIGYFSSVGIIKYTSIPNIEISKLNVQSTNRHLYDYTGRYIQTDPTEKLYSSQLKMYDNNEELIYDSGIVIHNTGNDTEPDEAIEIFEIPFDLKDGTIYKLRFTATTVNGLIVHSPIYRIMNTDNGGIDFEEVMNLAVIAKNNYSRGTVEVSFTNNNPNNLMLKGMYKVCRTENKEPYEWKFLKTIFCANEPIANIKLTDYTVEQGKTYLYSIQQYNYYDIESNRIISNPVVVDFEDYYLIDPERQLKIRYNPHISSMKNTVVETKQNTIGSKYPYIIRSGVVNYKEFQLAGLVSYHMDDDEDFIKWEDLGFTNPIPYRTNTSGDLSNATIPDFNLTRSNILAERIFKLEVLDWLNNGKPKILKSPTEGNYLVVLMGVSMTPTDTVGRMLHTFSASASEIGPFDYNTLVSYGFFNGESKRNEKMLVEQWKTINLSSIENNGSNNILPAGEVITTIDFKGVLPGTQIKLGDEIIYIGATGAYHAEADVPITSIIMPENYMGGGSIDYQTTGPLYTNFDNVRDYSDKYICGKQYIGNTSDDIIGDISNTRNKLMRFISLKLQKREIIDVYADYGEYQRGLSDTIQSLADFTIGDNLHLYYDALGQEPINNNIRNADNFIYDINNSTSLFKINWLNKMSTNGSDQFIQLNIRDTLVSNELYEGIYSEQSEMHYFYYNNENELIEFPMYSGYYYSPFNGNIMLDNFNLYSVDIGYYNDNNNLVIENINVNEKDYIEYDKSFQPVYLQIGDGVIANLTYIYQTIILSYEEDKRLNVATVKEEYNELLSDYWNYVMNINNVALNSEYSILSDDGITTKIVNYNSCITPLEQYNWRVMSNKYTQTLLMAIHNKYNELIATLDSAIESDLTRG